MPVSVSTMSGVLDVVRDEPDPDGTLTALVDRIEVEHEWVRVLMALGEEPRRPPIWRGPRRVASMVYGESRRKRRVNSEAAAIPKTALAGKAAALRG